MSNGMRKDVPATEDRPYGERPLYEQSGFDAEHEQARGEYIREHQSDDVAPVTAPEPTDGQHAADEKVARLNGVFDNLLVPIIAFTLVVVLLLGLLPGWIASCSSDSNTGEAPFDLYAASSELHSAMSDWRDKLENGGFTLMEDEEDGLIAYKKLDSGLEIMEHVIDSHGTPYTALMLTTGGEPAVEITLMVYTNRVRLVIVEQDGHTRSAVFSDGAFTSDPSNSDTASVLEWVSSEVLSDMLSQYEQIISVILDNR